MERVNYDRQSLVYDAGRRLEPEALAVWMSAATAASRTAVTRVLDLGAGTCRFSGGLADAFDSAVIAVEPSGGMRAEAVKKGLRDVHIVGGLAEELPLSTGVCQLAWLANVIHHMKDLPLAAQEVRRVVVPGGAVLIRGLEVDPTKSGYTLYSYFPEIIVGPAQVPSLGEVRETFLAVGFSEARVETIRQLSAPNLASLYERAQTRADTALERLADEAFRSGLARLKAASEEDESPVFDDVNLLVLR